MHFDGRRNESGKKTNRGIQSRAIKLAPGNKEPLQATGHVVSKKLPTPAINHHDSQLNIKSVYVVERNFGARADRLIRI